MSDDIKLSVNPQRASSGSWLPLERRLLPVAEVAGLLSPRDPAAGHGGVPSCNDQGVEIRAESTKKEIV